MKHVIAHVILGVFTAVIILLGAALVFGLGLPADIGWWALGTLFGSGLTLSFLWALENA